ncbi:MAG: hypothetical protein WKF89_09790 [Chitinophagaceae bacterium]
MFYLILPYALQQGEAAFINQYIAVAGKNILSPYATIFVDVLFFLTAFMAMVLIKIRYKKIPWIGSTIIGFLFLYIAFLWLISFLSYPKSNEVFLTGRQFMYISLSYFLWIAIFQSVTRDQYERFLKLMFYVTPISTIIYILNSSRIVHFFDETLIFQEVDFGMESFLRDFRTIPLWLIPILVLSIQSLLTSTINLSKKVVILNILILPVGVLFTFTRSLLFIVLMQVIFLLVLYGYRLNAKLIGNVILFVAFLSISFFAIQTVFPNQSSYFGDRLLSAKKEGKSEQNVNIRIEYVNEASKIVNQASPFIGAGMNRKSYPRMNAVGAWIADSTIPYFLVHTGWIGVLLIFGIVFVFFVDSFFLFMRTRDWLVGYLSAYFLSLFISSLIMGGEALTGNLWTLLNFSLYSVIKFNRWKPLPVTNEIA